MKTLDEVMDGLRRAILEAGLAPTTLDSYGSTVREYTSMLINGEISGVQDYLDYLTTVKKLAPNSVWHALNPLKFLYEKVLGKEFRTDYRLPKRNHNKPLRNVLNMRQILSMMATMEDRIPRLQTGMLAGCGLRSVSDMFTLRLKDVRLEDRIITIYYGKGGKCRPVRIPEFIVEDLTRQIEACRRQWERDRAKGIICPLEQGSLMRKLSPKTFGTLPWYWLFPSRVSHGQKRWHSTSKCLSNTLREAAETCGITQRVNPHAMRHSYATGLLRDGVDIRTIQKQLGHSNIATTEIYLEDSGMRTVASPLDSAARNIIQMRKPA